MVGTTSWPPLTRGLDFAQQKTGGENLRTDNIRPYIYLRTVREAGPYILSSLRASNARPYKILSTPFVYTVGAIINRPKRTVREAGPYIFY